MYLRVGSEQLEFVARFQGFGEDCIGVIVVYDHYVLVAAARCDWEASRLVTVDFAGDLDRLHEDNVCSFVGVGFLLWADGVWLC